MSMERIFYLIQRAGRWQIYDGDGSEPLAIQDSARAAAHWCRAQVGPGETPVIYSGAWLPRRSA